MFFLNKCKIITKKINIFIRKHKIKILFFIIFLICIVLNYILTIYLNFKTLFFIESKIGSYKFLSINSVSNHESELAFGQYLYKIQNKDLKIDSTKDINISFNFNYFNIFIRIFKNVYTSYSLFYFKYKNFYESTEKPDF